ncbi:hypothetical protein N2W54_006134 [Lotmaria passim]
MSELNSNGEPSEESFNVYRLRENPTWVKFGLRGAYAQPTQKSASSSFDTISRPSVSLYRGAQADSWPAVNGCSGCSKQRSCGQGTHYASCSASSYARPMHVEATSLADAGAQAALRHEQQERVQRRSCTSVPSMTAAPARDSDGASFASRVSHTSASSAVSPPMQASVPDKNPAVPFGSSTYQPNLSFLSDRTNLTTGATASKHQSLSVAASQVSDDTHPCDSRTSYRRSFHEPEATAPIEASSCERPSVSAARASVSRATATHLSGSAAVVDVAGPSDALYVPLRRPPPQNCEATRQHFNIFDVADREREKQFRGASHRGDVAKARVNYCTAHAPLTSNGGIWASEPGGSDAYQTSNSAYGQGC